MNDLQITMAAIRWHHAREYRLSIGREQRQYQQRHKAATGYASADYAIGERLTAARRVELKAAKELSALCAKLRNVPVQDADAVLDVPVRLLEVNTND